MSSGENFWIISVPSKRSKEESLSLIENCCFAVADAKQFQVPGLKVGNFDQLMAMSDELVKIDHMIELATKKIGQQIWSLRDPKPAKGEAFLTVDRGTITDYIRNFKWEQNVYPIRLSVKELAERLQQKVQRIDEEFRVHSVEYSTVASAYAQHQRSANASLNVRDLSDIVHVDDIIETEFFTTLFIVCTQNQLKEWEQVYESFTNAPDGDEPKAKKGDKGGYYGGDVEERPQVVEYVVPGSSRAIKTEGDQTLLAVNILKRFKDDFIRKVNKMKLTVREVKIDKESYVDGNERKNQLENDLRRQRETLSTWCQTHFSEAFKAWAHLKALRVHVESILRFGIPPDYVTAIIKLHKPGFEKKLRQKLEETFSEYGSVHIQDKNDDVPGFSSAEKFYPYVYLEMDLNYSKD